MNLMEPYGFLWNPMPMEFYGTCGFGLYSLGPYSVRRYYFGFCEFGFYGLVRTASEHGLGPHGLEACSLEPYHLEPYSLRSPYRQSVRGIS